MFTRYAKHWLAGEGFSWNSTDGPAYGITSPAYLIVVTVILGLTRCSDAVALAGASFSFGLLSALTLVLLGFLVQERKWSQKLWTPLLAVPCLLLVPPFRFHSLTGMETTFSLFANSLLACSIVIATRRRSTPALLLCLFSGALSFAARPDNGMYALWLPPLFFLATDRSLWRYSVRYALLFALVVGSSLIVNRYLFGDFLPLPFFAKRTGFYQGYLGAPDWDATWQECCSSGPQPYLCSPGPGEHRFEKDLSPACRHSGCRRRHLRLLRHRDTDHGIRSAVLLPLDRVLFPGCLHGNLERCRSKPGTVIAWRDRMALRCRGCGSVAGAVCFPQGAGHRSLEGTLDSTLRLPSTVLCSTEHQRTVGCPRWMGCKVFWR